MLPSYRTSLLPLPLSLSALPPPQVYLQYGGRAEWNQQRFKWNEYIVSAKHWNDHLPHTIQAVYYFCGDGSGEDRARRHRNELLRAYHLYGWLVPLVCIDKQNWAQPFTLVDPVS